MRAASVDLQAMDDDVPDMDDLDLDDDGVIEVRSPSKEPYLGDRG